MNYNANLLTYEEAKEISEKNKYFQEYSRLVQGYEVKIFDYIASSYPDFKKPLENLNKNALEMRGLTFVRQNDGSWKRFLAMHKFFNLNENESTEQSLFQNKNLKYYEKLDGSMVSFFQIPSGEIFPKTRIGLDNKQIQLVNAFLSQRENYKSFIQESISLGYSPIFEIISNQNKIIINYDKTELCLIQFRDNLGNYLDFDHELILKYKIKTLEKKVSDLDYLLIQQKNNQEKEGWIVECENFIFKLKTDWYFSQSKNTESILKANTLIKTIISGEIDDVISILDKNSPQRVLALIVKEKIEEYIFDKLKKSKKLFSEFSNFTSRKDFYFEKHKEQEYYIIYDFLGKNLEDLDLKIVDAIKKDVLKKTLRLNLAESFLKGLGIDLFKELNNLGSGLR